MSVLIDIILCRTDDIHIRIIVHIPLYLLEIVRFYPIIAIDKHHIFAFCVFYAYVSCIGYTSIGNMDGMDAFVFRGIFVNDDRRSIAATIVHNDEFPVIIGLRHDAVNAAAYSFSRVVGRNNNGMFWSIHSLISIFSNALSMNSSKERKGALCCFFQMSYTPLN